MMEAEKVRYAGYDGRLSDLNSDAPADFMPLVSDNWLLNFKWKGTGPIPAADREKLRDVVAKAHAHGRRIRLWATPDTTDMWRELRAGGVDMINTDDLAGLEKFLRESSASN
jgi:glycerophosphoryl diester phosphodiesterase